MCAISGIVDAALAPENARDVIGAMNLCQARRGPDGDGVFADFPVALGHRRLAVISPQNGDQPLFNETRDVVAVVNGEFYDYKAIGEKLRKRGHVFTTQSDAEILIHLYEEYGIDCVRKLDGMFAFALYDKAKRRILLGRDKLGKKPLLYRLLPGKLCFASTLDAMRCAPDFSEELDREAISDFLSFGYIPHPATVYRQIRKLPPAHTLIFDLASGKGAVSRYWQCDFSEKSPLSFSDAARELRKRVENAVSKRLQADVPLGIFLSGGIDSYLIAATAAKQLKGKKCDLFTIGFPERAYDESDASCRHFKLLKEINPNLRHHLRQIDPEHFNLIDFCSSHFGEPFADASMIPTHLLSAFAAKEVTVALSGDGADELFGGYDRYRAIETMARFQRLSPVMRQAALLLAGLLPAGGERTFCGRAHRFFNGFAATSMRSYFNWLDRAPEDKRQLLYGRRAGVSPYRHFENFSFTAQDDAEMMAEFDLANYLCADVLTKVDVSSMYYALEVRSPFLDDAVVDLSRQLPWRFKVDGSSRKKILSAAFADLLPSSFKRSRKRGFGVPVALWLRSAWKDFAGEELLHGALSRTCVVDPFGVRRLWSEHQSGEADHSYLLWHLLILSQFLGRN